MRSLLHRFVRPFAASSFALCALGAPMLGGCVVVMGGCDWTPAKFERTQTLNVAHVAGTGLDVQTENGRITVRKGGTSDVSIVAKIRASSQERADATVVSAVRSASSGGAGDNALVARVNWPNGERQSNEGCSFEITIPEAAWVRLVSSNGGIHVNALSGTAELTTSNARIEIEDHAGDLKAKTSNGGVHAKRITGAVTADTSNASVHLEDVGGFVKVNTSNGSIDAALSRESKGPAILKTSNASITLAVGPSFGGSLRASTSNGRIRNEVSGATYDGTKKSGTVTFATSGEESSASTSNGGITIKSR